MNAILNLIIRSCGTIGNSLSSLYSRFNNQCIRFHIPLVSHHECSLDPPLEYVMTIDTMLDDQKNGRDNTHLILPRQVSLKLNYYNKMRKIYYQLTLYPKTWLSRVQASKVLQSDQKKI